MRFSEMAALYAADLQRIEHVLMTSKIGSGEVATLIEAAGDLSMEGLSVEQMIRMIIVSRPHKPTYEENPDALIAKETAKVHEAAKDVRGYYQAVINRFLYEMSRIDHVSGTYAKLDYEDVRTLRVQACDVPTKPISYTRHIEIDEVVLTGAGGNNE